jgi:hypothetical protein
MAVTETDENYFVKILDEIRALREKYGLPKGVMLVPDRLEISLKRNSYDNFHLSYKEYFDYLPDFVLDLVMPIAINMLAQTGIPRERVVRIAKNGVGMEIDGTALMIMGLILSELSIQKRFTEEETTILVSSLERLRRAFADSHDLEFEWNNEIAERYFKILEQTGAVVMANPSFVSEMEAIPKKYSESIEKVRALLEKKDTETKSK